MQDMADAKERQANNKGYNKIELKGLNEISLVTFMDLMDESSSQYIVI